MFKNIIVTLLIAACVAPPVAIAAPFTGVAEMTSSAPHRCDSCPSCAAPSTAPSDAPRSLIERIFCAVLTFRHEVMHALNFAHNYYGPSVVVPGYSELYPELQVNDIKGLTDLYGPAPGYTPPTEGMYTLASGGAWPYDPIWGTTRIPYRFDESLNDIFPSGWQNQFRLVLDEFESVANLTFIEVGPEHQFKVMDVSAADIDGPGRTIAWAYYPAPHEIAWHSSPLYGNIIFDRTENWGILYPVPEPSTAALAVIGGLILICAWRRRRKT